MEERTGSFKPVKKKRGSFNAVDALIIILVLGVIIVFAVSRVTNIEETGEKIKFEYTVTLECVDSDFVDKISTGERVYDSSSQSFLGTVTAVVNDEPYTFYEYDETEDAMVLRTYPDKYNVKVTVSSKAQLVDGVGYMVGGCRIAVGHKLDLRFPEYVASAYCTDMREVK